MMTRDDINIIFDVIDYLNEIAKETIEDDRPWSVWIGKDTVKVFYREYKIFAPTEYNYFSFDTFKNRILLAFSCHITNFRIYEQMIRE